MTGGVCAEGGYTSSWECSVTEYGYAREPYNSERTFWQWARTEENVLYPDPTALRQESCRAPDGAADTGLQGRCADVALGEPTSAADCWSVGSDYVGVGQEMTWDDAEAYCVATFGGHLASIHSEQ